MCQMGTGKNGKRKKKIDKYFKEKAYGWASTSIQLDAFIDLGIHHLTFDLPTPQRAFWSIKNLDPLLSFYIIKGGP